MFWVSISLQNLRSSRWKVMANFSHEFQKYIRFVMSVELVISYPSTCARDLLFYMCFKSWIAKSGGYGKYTTCWLEYKILLTENEFHVTEKKNLFHSVNLLLPNNLIAIVSFLFSEKTDMKNDFLRKKNYELLDL